MIRFRGILHILGVFLIVFAITMLVPIFWGAYVGSGGLNPLGIGFAATLGCGLACFFTFQRPSTELKVREGILLTVVTWLAVTFFGAIPFWLSPQFASFTDAIFESASGFTTTGATILVDVEVLPPAIQFWRHFAHWLGGMGVVLLGIAVLPLIGVGGMALYRAEFSGARSEKLRPRIAETALALWRIYIALSVAQYLLLRVADMEPFDALCHTFSTLGTGGFSTRTASVGGFQNPAAEYIIIVFMILAGLNFTQHFRLWMQGEVRRFVTDFETRGFIAILAAATLICFIAIHKPAAPLEPQFRAALFQVSSIGTTTGFATADFELWPPVTHAVLLALMFVGGCTGSTAGGWKVARVLLLGLVVDRELKKTMERRGVFAVRAAGEVIPEATIHGLLSLVHLSLLVFLVALILLAASGVDLLTSITGVTAAMFSIGPGFGSVGPAENYAHLPALGKWVLSGCMIAGRLEFYTAVVVLVPAFWKK